MGVVDARLGVFNKILLGLVTTGLLDGLLLTPLLSGRLILILQTDKTQVQQVTGLAEERKGLWSETRTLDFYGSWRAR